MLNLNKVGRPLARIDGGKYSGRVVSVSDQFASNAKEGDDGLIKEFRQLKIANDSKFQHPRHDQGAFYLFTSRDPQVLVNLLAPENI